MGFAPKKNLNGREPHHRRCASSATTRCLDLTITREKFLVDPLDTMIARREGPGHPAPADAESTSRLSMPPALFRTVTDDERQLMIDELRK